MLNQLIDQLIVQIFRDKSVTQFEVYVFELGNNSN